MYRWYKENSATDVDFTKQFEAIIDFILQNCDDKVPNLRFLAVQTLQKYTDILLINQQLNSNAIKKIRKCFKEEADPEVKDIIKKVHKILKEFRTI